MGKNMYASPAMTSSLSTYKARSDPRRIWYEIRSEPTKASPVLSSRRSLMLPDHERTPALQVSASFDDAGITVSVPFAATIGVILATPSLPSVRRTFDA